MAPQARAATEGRSAVIVGGDERGQARLRIQAAFGFASLEWERGWNNRRVQALRDRVSHGSVDCVIFLRRFLNHKLCDVLLPATKEAGTLMVWVDQGYGVTAVERAVLRAIGEDEALQAR